MFLGYIVNLIVQDMEKKKQPHFFDYELNNAKKYIP